MIDSRMKAFGQNVKLFDTSSKRWDATFLDENILFVSSIPSVLVRLIDSFFFFNYCFCTCGYSLPKLCPVKLISPDHTDPSFILAFSKKALPD